MKKGAVTQLENQSGFGLLEAVFSIVILSTLTMGYLGQASSANVVSIRSQSLSTAINVVSMVTDDLYSVPASNNWLLTQAELPPGTPFPFMRYFTKDGRESNLVTSPYVVTWTITKDQPIAGARTLVVKVNWKDSNGSTKTIYARVVR